jgi:hypothetical protein
MAAALAARLPYLTSAPRFRDDTLNALLALKIYRGDQFPFTDVEAYIGAFFNYAVAAGMFIIGPTIYAARIVVMWFGVATVGATYVLGRELGGRLSGPLGGPIVGRPLRSNHGFCARSRRVPVGQSFTSDRDLRNRAENQREARNLFRALRATRAVDADDKWVSCRALGLRT